MIPVVAWSFDPSATWGALAARVDAARAALVAETHRELRIVPTQGLAARSVQGEGFVLVDLSLGQGGPDLLAFAIAHEWAHVALAHPATLWKSGGKWRTGTVTREQEDAADQWAGGFLARAGYDVGPVLGALRALPVPALGETTSMGAVRAAVVQAAYDEARGAPAGGEVCEDVHVPCVHKLHPFDTVPCTHDGLCPVACTHLCTSPTDVRVTFPCHRQDQAPCKLHPGGDRVPCVHPAHPEDVTRECR